MTHWVIFAVYSYWYKIQVSCPLTRNQQEAKKSKAKTNVFEYVWHLIQKYDGQDDGGHTLETFNGLDTTSSTILQRQCIEYLTNVVEYQGQVTKKNLSHVILWLVRVLINNSPNEEGCEADSQNEKRVDNNLNLTHLFVIFLNVVDL